MGQQTAHNGLLSQIFPASLSVYERSRDLELNGEIEAFWAGDRIRISRVKDGLRQIGQLQNYSFRAPKAAELPPQRLRFATELIKGAGYKGWVLLLDEIELIGSYTLLQRGRSYAELARWLGKAINEPYPGLVAVGTVTDDFASAVISPDGAKKDRDYISPKLEAGKYKDIAARAETGMRLLERECTPLPSPTETDVRETVEKTAGNLQHRLRLECSSTARRNGRRRVSEPDALQGPRLDQRMGLAAALP